MEKERSKELLNTVRNFIDHDNDELAAFLKEGVNFGEYHWLIK